MSKWQKLKHRLQLATGYVVLVGEMILSHGDGGSSAASAMPIKVKRRSISKILPTAHCFEPTDENFAN